ncbi:hypothetical protein PMAYCL1PPCAC_13494, partial [Pristionchus mayeri]
LDNEVFDQCKLVSGPLWTDYLRKSLDPNHDPMRSCNHSYTPWSLLIDGRVELTEACDGDSDCRARTIIFKGDYKISMGEWHNLSEDFVFENDFVEVECQIGNASVYNFLHHQIFRKDNFRTNGTSTRLPLKSGINNPPSVYMIVIDSMGASHGRRVFNRTQSFLKQEFGAVEMEHVNKVGLNSRPNGLAMLLGKLTEDINRDIYGLPSQKSDWNYTQSCRTFLDDKGFILKEFEKSGYITMMAEDWPLGVFNWPDCNGFQNQSATHYMRPFQLRFKDKSKQMKQDMGKDHCFEPHLFLNEYLEQFIRAYPDSPKASLVWPVDLAHDLPNEPFHADKQYLQLLERNRE